MKKILLPFCLFLSTVTLHGMELSSMASNGENHEDNKKIILQNDFKNFLICRLQECKKKPFTNDDIQHLQNTYSEMTNKKSLSILGDCLHRDACDEEGDNFVHYAARNRYLNMIEWAIKCMKRPLSSPNKAGKEPIDFCIDQLMPDASKDNKEETEKIFTALVVGYSKNDFDYEHRRSFAKKIVALEFEHVKHGIPYLPKTDILKSFCRQDIQLSDIYQEVCDEGGNTFTHMLVSHHLSDLLYTFLIKHYITFAVNKEKEDPLTLAQKKLFEVSHKHFEQCIANKSFDMAGVSQEDNQKKCCYYMLLNVQRKKDHNTDFKQCCEKHIIEKN